MVEDHGLRSGGEEVNLRDQTHYRVFLEEGTQDRGEEAWRNYELRSRRGRIWSYSKTQLSLLILSNKIGLRVQRQFPNWKLHQNGDNEMCFIVPDKDFGLAAEVIQAYKQKHLSEAQKAVAIQNLQKPGKK